MTLRDAIDNNPGSEMEKIILFQDESEIYNGTIFSLRETRKDLLDCTLKDDVKFECNRGYYAYLLEP